MKQKIILHLTSDNIKMLFLLVALPYQFFICLIDDRLNLISNHMVQSAIEMNFLVPKHKV